MVLHTTHWVYVCVVCCVCSGRPGCRGLAAGRAARKHLEPGRHCRHPRPFWIPKQGEGGHNSRAQPSKQPQPPAAVDCPHRRPAAAIARPAAAPGQQNGPEELLLLVLTL